MIKKGEHKGFLRGGQKLKAIVWMISFGMLLSGCGNTVASLVKKTRPQYISTLEYNYVSTKNLLLEQGRMMDYMVQIVQEVMERERKEGGGAFLHILGWFNIFHGIQSESAGHMVVGGVCTEAGSMVIQLQEMNIRQLKHELRNIKGRLEAISSLLDSRGVEKEKLYSEEKVLVRCIS